MPEHLFEPRKLVILRKNGKNSLVGEYDALEQMIGYDVLEHPQVSKLPNNTNAPNLRSRTLRYALHYALRQAQDEFRATQDANLMVI